MSNFYDGQAFLQSWKAGVKLAGSRWFGDGSDPEAAETKWDLAPRTEHIKANIGLLSTSEAVFLAALVSFYNDRIGGPMLQQVIGYNEVGLADIAASLDEPRRRVIGGLLLSYCGW